jgi:hypothetical protein
MSQLTRRRLLSDYAPLLLILLVVLLTRILCFEHLISGYDPGNYWLALDGYSIKKERPHPPGYPVYVGMLHGLVALTGDRHVAMLTLHLLFSLAAVVALYLLAKQWLGARGATLATALLAINPLFWLYGATSENYSWDAFFGVTAILALIRARGREWLVAGIFFGVAAGVRGASVVLMLPVVLYVLYTRRRSGTMTPNDLVMAGGGALAGLLLWLPVTAAKVGGLLTLMHDATGVTTASAGPFIGTVIGMVITFIWTLNLTSIYLILRWKRFAAYRVRLRGIVASPSLPVVLLLWVVPQLLFFVLVIYAKGYALVLLPAICIATAWLLLNERSVVLRAGITSVLLLAHALVFLAVPYNSPPAYTTLAPRNRTTTERLQSVLGRSVSVYLPSFWRIRASDAQVAEALAMVRGAVGNGDDTTSIVLDPSVGMFAGPRTMQVYMPRATFISPGIGSYRLVAYHHGIDKVERYGDTASLAAPRLLLLTDRGLAERYSTVAAAILPLGEYYALMEVPAGRDRELRGRLDDLFVRW